MSELAGNIVVIEEEPTTWGGESNPQGRAEGVGGIVKLSRVKKIGTALKSKKLKDTRGGDVELGETNRKNGEK